MADEKNAITSTRDSVDEDSMKDEEDSIKEEEEEDQQPESKERTLLDVNVKDDNKSVTEKAVSANFPEIKKAVLNPTMQAYKPVEANVCCVRACKSRSDKGDDNISYHRFPPPGANKVYLLDTSAEQREMDQREAWGQLLRLEKSPTDHMLVCSIHFRYQDFIDPETDIPSKRALHPQAVPIRCPPSYEGLRETILKEIRKERKLLAKAQPLVPDEEACARRVQQLASEWSDGEDSRPDTQPEEGFTQEEWLNEEEWMSEAELEDEKLQIADMHEEPLEEEYLSDMDGWDDPPNHQPEATVNGNVAELHGETVKEEDEELDREEEEDMRLYDFDSSASMTSNEDILEKLTIDLRAEQPTIFLPLLGDAATRILSDELASVKRLVKETRARVRDARALKNQQADEIVLLRKKNREMERDLARGYTLDGSL